TVFGIDRQAILLVLKLLEELQAASAADARLRKIGCAGKVGRALLGAGEGHEIAKRRALAGVKDAHACVGRSSSGDGGGGQHQRQDADLGGGASALADAQDVTASDVAEFVGDDALKLVDIVGRGQKSGMDIDDLPARDEGVDRVI